MGEACVIVPAAEMDLTALNLFISRLAPGSRVLDAGCGRGEDLRFLSEQGLSAEGLDLDPELAREAQNNAPLASVSCRDIRLFSPQKESFDGIWANRLIHMLSPPDCLRVMGTFFRALKPGGWLYCSFLSGDGDGRLPEHEVHALLRQNGFEIQSRGQNLKESAEISLLARRLGARQ